jgi:hypothetical protein
MGLGDQRRYLVGVADDRTPERSSPNTSETEPFPKSRTSTLVTASAWS